jgi:hypothetical protein
MLSVGGGKPSLNEHLVCALCGKYICRSEEGFGLMVIHYRFKHFGITLKEESKRKSMNNIKGYP